MRYGQIRRFDVANGPGIRVSVFVTGCTHHCPECFNGEYQDFQAGELWTEKETQQVLDYLSHPQVQGLTLLGGEPLQNVEGLLEVVKAVRERFGNEKDLWIYSGYTLEQILKNEKMKELVSYCDVLVDGLFVNALKDLKLRFRGSSNQRILNVKDSLAQGEPVWEEAYR